MTTASQAWYSRIPIVNRMTLAQQTSTSGLYEYKSEYEPLFRVSGQLTSDDRKIGGKYRIKESVTHPDGSHIS